MEQSVSESDMHDPGRQAEGDQADRPEDVSISRDVFGEGTHGPHLEDHFRSAGLVADVTLAQGVTYTPGALRVLRTSYVFRINTVVRGSADGDYVTVNDTGGEYPDGSTVSTERSFRLSPGGRYLVFAERVGEELWLREVLQVHADGGVVADASGRVLVGIQEGVPVAEVEPTYGTLGYVRAPAPSPQPMQGPPDEGSEALPDQAEPAAVRGGPRAALDVDTVVDFLRTAQGRGSIAAGPASSSSGGTRTGETPSPGPPGAPGGGPEPPADRTARAVLAGSHVTGFQSHYHFIPDDNNWAWTSHCRGSWNTLVNNNLGLFAYKITAATGQPIRNRTPVADNNENNLGVLTNAQMTAGGYDTWDVLGANGVCYRWVDGNNRIRETDILINPAIAGNEAQFRKSLTHEYGHALTLDHETARMALLYPGTFRQPPNYASLWYSRQDDHHGVRSMLSWVNSTIAAGTWDIAQFTDMATWSQAHEHPGTTGNLVMTRISSEALHRGDTATLQFVHVENRGNVPAQNVRLKFYLSTDESISAADHEIASYTWSSFSAWWSGSLTVRIPTTVPAGQYFLGWIVTTDTPERSSANNIAILLRDYTTGFAKVKITIT
jgi:hypothetical protein